MKSLFLIGAMLFSTYSYGFEVTECLLTSETKGNESAINEFIVREHRPLTISSVEIGRTNPAVPETEFITIKGFHSPDSVKTYVADMVSSEDIDMELRGCHTKNYE